MKENQTLKMKLGTRGLLLVAVLSIAVGLLPVPARAETAYDLLWLKQFWGMETYDNAHGIALDGQGNSYVTGRTRQATWDAIRYMFVAKYSPAGETLWVRQVRDAESRNIVVDANGNAFVSGYTTAALEAGKAAAGKGDIFLAKLNEAGEMLWVKQLGSAQLDYPGGIAMDANGRVFVTGYTEGSLEAGKANLGATDGFLAAFSAVTGETLWVKQFGTTGSDYPGSVKVDGDGNVFMTGSTHGSFEGGGRPGNTVEDVFIAKLSPSTREMLWVKQFGSSSSDGATALALDATGNAFVTGYTWGDMEEGHLNYGDADVFLAKVSAATGDVLWVRQFGTIDAIDLSTDAVVNATGDVFLAGSYQLLTNYWADTTFAKFSGATGQKLWEKRLNGEMQNYPNAMALDQTGDVLVVGGTDGDLLKGDTLGLNDFYIARFGVAVKSPAEQITAILEQFRHAIAAGSITVSGPGNSARARENALLNMLLSAEKLIATGDVASACTQLSHAYLRMDAASRPPDFIAGTEVAPIAAKVSTLQQSLHCK